MINRFFLVIFLLASTAFFSFAQYNVQSKYFVYLQTEPAQPFYIKIGGQNLSANASGYLILPQLKDGDYKMVVGFPQTKAPEQTFNFKIDSKDKGYLIKDFGAEGWGLFDLQTMAVQKPIPPNSAPAVAVNNPAPKQEAAVPAEGVSDFTKVLSKAANDPSLLEKPKPEEKPVVKEAPPVVVKPAEEKPAEVIAIKETAKEEVREVVTSQNKAAPAGVVKLSQNRTNEGIHMVYEDRNSDGTAEQINVFIPSYHKPEPIVETKPPAIVEQPKPIAADTQKEKFEVQEKPAIKEEPRQQEIKQVVQPSANCKSIADENDFLKLRRQMAQKDNDDLMIAEAKKAFKNKCYTTAQIKYLSSMFLSNAGKYNFYEAAKPHIADGESFSTLRSEIKDAYYIDKFDALAGQ